MKRKTVLIFWTVRFAFFNELPYNGHFFNPIRSAVIFKKRITESFKTVRIRTVLNFSVSNVVYKKCQVIRKVHHSTQGSIVHVLKCSLKSTMYNIGLSQQVFIKVPLRGTEKCCNMLIPHSWKSGKRRILEYYPNLFSRWYNIKL